MKLTIFTPAYNRAFSLPRLYKSLCDQTNKNFEWLIVDDGSRDNTEDVVAEFIKENSIHIKYLRQSNGGKHRAVNLGLKEAAGELFFIVDSDDWLAKDAVEKIITKYDDIRNLPDFAGVCGLKVYPSGEKIGGENDFGIIDCTSLDFRYKYNMRGDMAEAFKTDILRNYPFPEYEGENFCPEALVWNRIAKNYKLRYFYERIYVCEYLPDGLTAKITKIRHGSPAASCTHYSELSNLPIPLKQKIKAMINFWRFHSRKCNNYRYNTNIFLSVPCYLPGKLLKLYDRYSNKYQ